MGFSFWEFITNPKRHLLMHLPKENWFISVLVIKNSSLSLIFGFLKKYTHLENSSYDKDKGTWRWVSLNLCFMSWIGYGEKDKRK